MLRLSINRPKNDTLLKDTSKNSAEPKAKEKKDENPRLAEQVSTSLSLETKIAKIKIVVPLSELLKNADYQYRITKVLNPSRERFAIADSLNLQDDDPTIISGLM